jgi:hypothetical protein
MNNRIKRFDPTNLTAAGVLEKIQEIYKRHEPNKQIGVDTIALMLHINLADLQMFLDELQQDGHIMLHASRNAGKGVPKLTDAGTLSLLTN